MNRHVNTNDVWIRLLKAAQWPALASKPAVCKALEFTGGPAPTSSDERNRMLSTINPYKLLFHVLRPPRWLVPLPPEPPSAFRSGEQLMGCAASTCRIAMLGPKLDGKSGELLWRLVSGVRPELVRLQRGPRFGRGIALTKQPRSENASRTTAVSTASDAELRTTLSTGEEDDTSSRTFLFDIVFTTLCSERGALAAAMNMSRERSSGAALSNRPLTSSVASASAAAPLPEDASQQIQVDSDAALVLRELLFRIIAAEREVPEALLRKVALASRVERTLRDGCDAVLYAVDSARLASASGAAEVRAELWALLRAAMPDVYLASSESACEADASASAQNVGGLTAKIKPLLVLSLSVEDCALTNSEIELPPRRVGVLQLARLDIAHLRTPWLLVPCRVPLRLRGAAARGAEVGELGRAFAWLAATY